MGKTNYEIKVLKDTTGAERVKDIAPGTNYRNPYFVADKTIRYRQVGDNTYRVYIPFRKDYAYQTGPAGEILLEVRCNDFNDTIKKKIKELTKISDRCHWYNAGKSGNF